MRGFNDFNILNHKGSDVYNLFPSPCGVLMILIEMQKRNLESFLKVSVPMRGFNDFN